VPYNYVYAGITYTGNTTYEWALDKIYHLQYMSKIYHLQYMSKTYHLQYMSNSFMVSLEFVRAFVPAKKVQE